MTRGVEQADDDISVGFFLREDLAGAVIDNSLGRNRILVNREDSRVLQVLQIQRIEVSEVDA